MKIFKIDKNTSKREHVRFCLVSFWSKFFFLFLSVPNFLFRKKISDFLRCATILSIKRMYILHWTDVLQFTRNFLFYIASYFDIFHLLGILLIKIIFDIFLYTQDQTRPNCGPPSCFCGPLIFLLLAYHYILMLIS